MRRGPRRSGVTLLEIQVSLVVLGIGLAGLCPILVMQSRVLRKIESTSLGERNPQVVRGLRIANGETYGAERQIDPEPITVLQPHPDAWVRRLGLPATFASQPVGQTYNVTPTAITLDYDRAVYSGNGAWTLTPDAKASRGAVMSLPAGSTETATWTFSDIAPGWYVVRISWGQETTMTNEATFTVDGATTGIKVGDAAISADGKWRTLDTFQLIKSSDPSNPEVYSTTVKLSGSPDGQVFADAVQIVPIHSVSIVPLLIHDPPASADGMKVRVQIGNRP